MGGAALSNRFTRLRIATEYDGLVAYASDAMTGLSLANTIQEADEREQLTATLQAETQEILNADRRRRLDDAVTETANVPPAQVRHDFAIPTLQTLRLHVLRDYDMDKIFPYINPQYALCTTSGVQGSVRRGPGRRRPQRPGVADAVRRVEDVVLARPTSPPTQDSSSSPAAQTGSGCWSMLQTVRRCWTGSTLAASPRGDGLCLSDYILPKGSDRPKGPDKMDYVAMFVTTIGNGVIELSEQWKREGQFLNSHIVQALALESAEAFAELLHQQIRQMWGFGDPPDITYTDLFRTQYRGRRSLWLSRVSPVGRPGATLPAAEHIQQY